MDENDYLNGSTAGFGKKLREINREINQEEQAKDEGLNFKSIHNSSKHSL